MSSAAVFPESASAMPAGKAAAGFPDQDTATGIDPVLSSADLDRYRAGETIVIGNQSLTASTTGNVLEGDYSAGAVTVSGNALSNFSGIGNFAINTGAQVSLQSAMNLTINIGQ